MGDATPFEKGRLAPPRMLVMGVGSSGVRAVEAMARLNPDIDFMAVDTDKKVLEAVALGKTLNVGETITRGFSAGGDVELGRQAIEKDSTTLRRQLSQINLLVLVAGLGGGTGSGAVPVIARIAREAGALVLCLVAMPFRFEGQKTVRVAEESLKRIRTHSDAIIRIQNERLIDADETELPAEEAFKRGHRLMADGLFSLARLLVREGLCGLDFASIQTMLRNCDGFCHQACTEASGIATRAAAVLEGILEHRQLNKGKLLESAAGVIVGLTGGPDLRLSEIESFMEGLQARLPREIWLNMGVCTDPDFAGRLAATVLVAEQWKEPLVDGANRPIGLPFTHRSGIGQGELPLEVVGKGEFAYADPTIHNHQDLDVPTYIRHEIKLPR